MSQKRRQGGNAEFGRNEKSQTLPQPAEPDLHSKSPNVEERPEVTQLGKRSTVTGTGSNSKAKTLPVDVVLF